MQIPYLTQDEQRAVELLASGKTLEQIARALELSEPRKARYLLDTLVRKTGISQRSPERAKAYLRAVEQAFDSDGPNHEQIALIQNIANDGFPRALYLAPIKHTSAETTEKIALHESALNAAGIFSRNPGEVRVQCCAFLAGQKPIPLLSDKCKAALRLYANGCRMADIAAIMGESMNALCVEKLIRTGCDALGVTSRGRGVQRRLLAIALERMEPRREQSEQKPDEITMSDPLF